MATTAVNKQYQGSFNKKVGSTRYKVNVYFGAANREPLDDKILRMMRNDLNFERKSDKIISLQTSRLPERGSL
jgi:hypothetical protein